MFESQVNILNLVKIDEMVGSSVLMITHLEMVKRPPDVHTFEMLMVSVRLITSD